MTFKSKATGVLVTAVGEVEIARYRNDAGWTVLPARVRVCLNCEVVRSSKVCRECGEETASMSVAEFEAGRK